MNAFFHPELMKYYIEKIEFLGFSAEDMTKKFSTKPSCPIIYAKKGDLTFAITCPNSFNQNEEREEYKFFGVAQLDEEGYPIEESMRDGIANLFDVFRAMTAPQL